MIAYRTDIDGLRAVAVVSVILFHLGFLPNGYLGVDIFFVISGYLITGIVYNESLNGKFSILKFYERRIRRIIPLTLFITTLALIIGYFVMLPDDLENLSQAVVASNLSVNNILMYVSSADYWAVKNDYKPLMHTWSLGIEEQFYLIFPFLFLLQGKRLKYVKTILIVLTVLSLILFMLPASTAAKFYFIHYRFYQLAIGGLAAIHFNNRPLLDNVKNRALLIISSLVALALIFLPLPKLQSYDHVLMTLCTCCILVLGGIYYDKRNAYKGIMTNPVFMTLGKISFSLYMWHQLVFAFARYLFLEEITPLWAAALFALIVVLSFGTYHLIENPFRSKQRFSVKRVLIIVIAAFLISSVPAFYIYSVGGIIKDYPSLSLYRKNLPKQKNAFDSKYNIHMYYNEDVRKLDKDFDTTDKKKVLVIGNSHGRDVTNVFLESSFKDQLEIRYFDIGRLKKDKRIRKRMEDADYIFLSARGEMKRTILNEVEELNGFKIDRSKIGLFGTKDFGYSNGIHYNRIGPNFDYTAYRTNMKKDTHEINEALRAEWGDRFIDMITLVEDSQHKVLVFTPEGKFISQDTVHFTKDGATYFAVRLRETLMKILGLG